MSLQVTRVHPDNNAKWALSEMLGRITHRSETTAALWFRSGVGSTSGDVHFPIRAGKPSSRTVVRRGAPSPAQLTGPLRGRHRRDGRRGLRGCGALRSGEFCPDTPSTDPKPEFEGGTALPDLSPLHAWQHALAEFLKVQSL